MHDIHNNNPYKNHPYYMKQNYPQPAKHNTIEAPASPAGRTDIINVFRRLWFEHVMWTRSVITSAASDNPDLNDTTARLLENPADFAAVLRPYYGKEKSEKFKQLFTDHLVIANDLMGAHKAHDLPKALSTRAKWYNNAAEIAAFMSQLNPYWPENEFKEMMNTHLKLTEEEMLSRLNKDYKSDIKKFDMIEEEALQMADMMAYGLMKQFSM